VSQIEEFKDLIRDIIKNYPEDKAVDMIAKRFHNFEVLKFMIVHGKDLIEELQNASPGFFRNRVIQFYADAQKILAKDSVEELTDPIN